MKKAIKVFSAVMAVVIFCVFTLGAAAEAFANGIDVSYWQSYFQGTYREIDFAKVKNAGNQFVIMRIGTSYGPDSTFENNYKKAKAAGLDVGCYFYTYAKTVEESLKDAKNVVTWLGDKQFEYPVYFDIEDATLESLSKEDKMAICETFASYVSQAGFLVGIYCNPYWLNYQLDTATVKNSYELWLAHWTDSGNPDVDKSSDCRLWQYSAKGTVDGIAGEVDMAVSYFDYPTYIKENGLNNYPKTVQPDPEPEPDPDPDPEPTPDPEPKPEDSFDNQIKVLKKIFSVIMQVIKILAGLLN